MIDPLHIKQIARDFDVQLQSPVTHASDFPDWAALADLVHQLTPQILQEQPVIAISGSQGSGKSTLAKVIARGPGSSPVVSLDDFYLTKAQRVELSTTVHPLLATRGVPGTHDHEWLGRLLAQVRSSTPTEVPQFNKGTDDRSGSRLIKGGGLILEGWCLGVRPETIEQLAAPCNNLERDEDPDGRWRTWVNNQLTDHYQSLWSQVEFWIHLRIPSFAQIMLWRTQQEQALPPEQRMDEAALERFIQHYERLTRALWRQPPIGPGLLVDLNEDHEIAGISAIPFR